MSPTTASCSTTLASPEHDGNECDSADCKRIDFIRELPMELVCKVLWHLEHEFVLLECLVVSKDWRTRLLECPQAWSHVKVDRMELSPRALVLVGKHIQCLSAHCCGGRWFTMLFEAMIAGAFPRLRTLKVTPMARYHIDQQLTEDGLRHVSSTLRTLCIECPAGTLINLRSVFASCPRLTTLDFWHTSGLGIIDTLPAMTALTTLTLVQRTCIMSEEPLQRIVDACPNLERLSLRLCEPSQLAFLARRLPKLQTLYFNNYGASVFAKDPSISSSSSSSRVVADQHRHRAGLKRLVAESMHIPDLIEVLQMHCGTLETLVLDLTGSTGADGRLARPLLRPLHMERLQTLEYDAQNTDHGEAVLEWLLAGCSALQKVQISCLNGDCDRPRADLFRHLSRMTRLRYLSLQDMDTVDGLQDYADTLGDQGPTCALQSLMLHECTVTDSQLDALGRVRSLQNINILYPDDCISTAALNRFFASHHDPATSVLARVKLFAVNCVTRETLATIGKMSALESLLLYFHAGSRIHKEDAVAFAEQYPHIKLKCFGRHFE